jgi:hypothetical protein
VREIAVRKQLVIRFISTGDQLTYGFTKAMSVQKLKKFQYDLILEGYNRRDVRDRNITNNRISYYD